MKKVIFFVILVIFMFLPTKVLATDLEPSYGDSVKICEYENHLQYKNSKDSNENKLIKLKSAIYYSPNSDKYELIYQGLKVDNEIKSYSIKSSDPIALIPRETLNKTKFKEMIEAYQCPSYAYFDLPDALGAIGEPKFFDEPTDEKFYLETKHKEKSWTITNAIRTFNFMSEQEKIINTMLDKYLAVKFSVYPDKSLEENPFCNNLKNKREDENGIVTEYITEIETQIKKQLIQSYFIHSDWQVEDIPDFMLNTNAFDKVASVVNTKFNSAYDSCQKVIENDQSLSEEQRQEYIGNVSENINDLAEGLGNYANFRIKSIEKYKIDWGGEEGCEGFLGSRECPTGTNCEPAYYLDLTLNIMKYGAIILTFALSTMDFIKATINQYKDQLKKSTTTAVKRLIAAIVIFFLPILINFILSLLGAYTTCKLS